MKLVILESPYAGNVERNLTYGRACLADALSQGESPIASHLLLTQEGVLDDTVPSQREIGLEAGWAWYRVAQACVVYCDHGISSGMKDGIERAKFAGVPISYRKIL